MESVGRLLDKAREHCSLASDNALSQRLGVSRQVVSDWRAGLKPISTERIAQLCALAGEDAPRWNATINAERATTQTERNMWRDTVRRLSTAAAVLLLLGSGLFSPLSVANHGVSEAGRSIHYANWLAGWLRRVLRAQVRPLALLPA